MVNTSKGALRGVCRSNPQASSPRRELLAPHPGGFPGLPRRGCSLLGLAPGWPSSAEAIRAVGAGLVRRVGMPQRDCGDAIVQRGRHLTVRCASCRSRVQLCWGTLGVGLLGGDIGRCLTVPSNGAAIASAISSPIASPAALSFVLCSLHFKRCVAVGRQGRTKTNKLQVYLLSRFP